jgi:hypothetical protein
LHGQGKTSTTTSAIKRNLARKKAEENQTIVVARWPSKPVMTSKAAIREFGEEVGLRIARIVNSGKRTPSRLPDLEKIIISWAKGSGLSVAIFQLPPNARPLTWKTARQWATKAEKDGALAFIVAGT